MRIIILYIDIDTHTPSHTPSHPPSHTPSHPHTRATRYANGLLLYTDDGGATDFLEVKLVSARLRVRASLDRRKLNTVVSGTYADDKWHLLKVQAAHALSRDPVS